jgi:hypothetical protein
MLGLFWQPFNGSQLSSVQTFLSSQLVAAPGLHWPALQASPVVQIDPSSHGELLATNLQPAIGSHESLVHKFESLHITALPATQAPLKHVSPCVHTLPSLQVPALAKCWQPLTELQLSSVHTLPSLQSVGPPLWHLVCLHWSPLVHASPSSHAAVFATNMHPSLASHVSLVQMFTSSQGSNLPGTHAPLLHMSPSVQTVPSSQGTSLATWLQPLLGTQASAVQTFLSSHGSITPLGEHAPAKHTAPGSKLLSSRQALSLHTVPSATALFLQPLALSHVSAVQALPSSQAVPAPARQTPPAHKSPSVHASPSLQVPLLFLWLQPLAGSHKSSVHGLPSLHATVVGTWLQPLAGSQPSSVHMLLSLQPLGKPPLQVALAQLSDLVHGLPSSHGDALGAWMQPTLGSHASPVQGLLSSQLVGPLGKHTTTKHVSPVVHALPSSQACPSPVATWAHDPLSHVSCVHEFLSSQSGLILHAQATAVPEHAPPLHLSLPVHGLPSSHAAELAVLTQPTPGKHASSVQELPSSQTTALPGAQVLPLHKSAWVQALPSLQVAPAAIATATHLPLSHELAVHGFLSAQSAAVAQLQLGVPAQTPEAHRSPLVHVSPSSQVAAVGKNTQLPDLGSQLSAVHGLLSVQAT